MLTPFDLFHILSEPGKGMLSYRSTGKQARFSLVFTTWYTFSLFNFFLTCDHCFPTGMLAFKTSTLHLSCYGINIKHLLCYLGYGAGLALGQVWGRRVSCSPCHSGTPMALSPGGPWFSPPEGSAAHITLSSAERSLPMVLLNQLKRCVQHPSPFAIQLSPFKGKQGWKISKV